MKKSFFLLSGLLLHSRRLPLRSNIHGAIRSAPPSSLAGDKLFQLRDEMKKRKLDVFIVPSEDPHMSEYPPANYCRREFISGFTGSAGVAVVSHDSALLFTDGRYFEQAER